MFNITSSFQFLRTLKHVSISFLKTKNPNLLVFTLVVFYDGNIDSSGEDSDDGDGSSQ